MNKIRIFIKSIQGSEAEPTYTELITTGTKWVINYLYPEIVRDYCGNICSRPAHFHNKRRITITGLLFKPDLGANDEVQIIAEYQQEKQGSFQIVKDDSIEAKVESLQLKVSANNEFTWEMNLQEK